jgi:hypothetical protein
MLTALHYNQSRAPSYVPILLLMLSVGLAQRVGAQLDVGGGIGLIRLKS